MLEVFFKKSDMNAFMFIDARGKLQVLFLKRSPPCFLRPGLSLATNLPSRVGWPTNMVWRASFPHFRSSGITGTYHHVQTLLGISRHWTQVFELERHPFTPPHISKGSHIWEELLYPLSLGHGSILLFLNGIEFGGSAFQISMCHGQICTLRDSQERWPDCPFCT